MQARTECRSAHRVAACSQCARSAAAFVLLPTTRPVGVTSAMCCRATARPASCSCALVRRLAATQALNLHMHVQGAVPRRRVPPRRPVPAIDRPPHPPRPRRRQHLPQPHGGGGFPGGCGAGGRRRPVRHRLVRHGCARFRFLNRSAAALAALFQHLEWADQTPPQTALQPQGAGRLGGTSPAVSPTMRGTRPTRA